MSFNSKFFFYMNKITILCIVVFATACGSRHEKSQSAEYTLKGDTIIIQNNEHLFKNLKIDTVTPEAYSTKFSIPGIVRAIPNNYAQVASPFSGLITKSFVRLCQHVDVDSPIFEISSPSFFDVGKHFTGLSRKCSLLKKTLRGRKTFLQTASEFRKMSKKLR
jgi:cobalt-zinc-cadmium efflux system membrane fusion protein